MLLRAVSSEDRSEQQYWSRVRSDPVSERERSRPTDNKSRPITIADIDDQEDLQVLLDPNTYSPNSPLRDQLCSLILTTGSHWSLAVPSTFFATPAGRTLLMCSTVHAATKRTLVRKDTCKTKVIPSFDQLLPAYFWAPLVHRLRDAQVWGKFYRQQHRLNGRTMIGSGLAKAMAPRFHRGDRFDHWDIAFLTDAELGALWDRLVAARSPAQRMQILNIHPGDRYMFD